MIGANNVTEGCPVPDDFIESWVVPRELGTRGLIAAKRLGFDYPVDEMTLLCNFHGSFNYTSQSCVCDGFQDPAKACSACLPDRNSKTYPACDLGCNSFECNSGRCDDSGLERIRCPAQDLPYLNFAGYTAWNKPDDEKPFGEIIYEKAFPLKKDAVDCNQRLTVTGPACDCDDRFEECLEYESFDPNTGEKTQGEKCVDKADGELCLTYAFNTVSKQFQPFDAVKCMTYEECCNGVCCGSNEVCRENEHSTSLAKYEWINSAGVEVPEEQRNRCSSYKMEKRTVARSYIRGIANASAILIATAIVVLSCGFGSPRIVFTSLLDLACCIILAVYKTETLLLAAGPLTAIAFQRDGLRYTSVVVQFVIFIVCFCSVDFIRSIVSQPVGFIGFLRRPDFPDCADDYDHFRLPDLDIAWDEDNGMPYTGLCSPTFFGFSAMFEVFALFFYMLHMVASFNLAIRKDK